LVGRGDLAIVDAVEGYDETLFVLVGWLNGAKRGSHRDEPFWGRCKDDRQVEKCEGLGAVV
jgi:hypothetical protein